MRKALIGQLGLAIASLALAACSLGGPSPTPSTIGQPADAADWSSPATAALSADLMQLQSTAAVEPRPMPIDPAAASADLSPTEQRLFSSLAAMNAAGTQTGFANYRPLAGPVAFAGYDVYDETRTAVPTTLLVLGGESAVPRSSTVVVDPALGLPGAVRTADPDLLETLLGTQFDLDFSTGGQVVPVFAYRLATDGVSVDDNPTAPTWSPASTLVHELFHTYQRDPQWWSDRRTDEVFLPDEIIDTAGIVLATMEEQALRSALDGTDVFDPGRTGQARATDRPRVLQELQRFLALRAARVANNPELADYLDVTETEEGTAEWVTRNTALWAGDTASFDQLKNQLGRVGNRAYYGDGSTYNVGVALLTILDALGTQWRTDITTTGIQEIATAAHGQRLPTKVQAQAPFDVPALEMLVQEQHLADQPRGRR